MIGNAGGRYINFFFIFRGSADQGWGAAGGQKADAGPECGKQYRNYELILLSKSEILQIKVTLIHSVLYIK